MKEFVLLVAVASALLLTFCSKQKQALDEGQSGGSM